MIEWFYIFNGKVKHAVRNRRLIAQCGVSPAWFDAAQWRGTGSQAESERLAELPACKRCVKLGYLPTEEGD